MIKSMGMVIFLTCMLVGCGNPKVVVKLGDVISSIQAPCAPGVYGSTYQYEAEEDRAFDVEILLPDGKALRATGIMVVKATLKDGKIDDVSLYSYSQKYNSSLSASEAVANLGVVLNNASIVIPKDKLKVISAWKDEIPNLGAGKSLMEQFFLGNLLVFYSVNMYGRDRFTCYYSIRNIDF